MAFRQLFKCFSCSSTKETTTYDESFTFSAINEISEIAFDQTDDQHLNEATKDSLPGLTKTEANEAIIETWNKLIDLERTTYAKELNLRTFFHTPSGKVFRWSQCTNTGDAPDNGRSLWIVLNGSDISTNEEGVKLNGDGSIWLIPRCSTDWQQEYLDLMLDRLIEHHIIVNEVNPNRVFLIGISPAGGDGVFQLAPRIADRLAAAGVMSGHPKDASPLGLRNLPFALFMTGQTHIEKHMLAARTWAQSLAEYSREHIGGGYHYWIKIGSVEKQKLDALVWTNKHIRNPWPTRIVWHHQGFISHKRFYWIALPFPEQVKKGQTIVAEVRNRKNIYLEEIPGEIKAITIRLSDTLVNLDQTVTVSINRDITTTKVFHGIVPRTRTAIDQSLEERADPMSAATALLHVIWNSKTLVSCHSPANTEVTCPVCSLQTNQT